MNSAPLLIAQAVSLSMPVILAIAGLVVWVILARILVRKVIATSAFRNGADFGWWEAEHDRWTHMSVQEWLNSGAVDAFNEDGEFNHERYGPEYWHGGRYPG